MPRKLLKLYRCQAFSDILDQVFGTMVKKA